MSAEDLHFALNRLIQAGLAPSSEDICKAVGDAVRESFAAVRVPFKCPVCAGCGNRGHWYSSAGAHPVLCVPCGGTGIVWGKASE